MATTTEVVGNGFGRWKIEITQTSTNYAANTSVVRVRGTMINEGTSRSFNNTGPSMSISGSASWSDSAVPFDCAANGGSDLVIDESFTIAHLSNGSKTVSFTITYGATGTSTFGGPESVSDTLALTNHAQAPDAPVSSFSAVTATSATVTCTVPDANYSAIDDYDIQVDDNSDFSSPVGTYARGASVTGLTPGVKYYVRSRAHNGIGWSAWSAAVNFTTSSTAPSTPAAPVISDIVPTGCRVSWAAPASNGSAITGYTVQIATNSGFTTGVATFTPSPATNTYVDITTLSPGVTYWVRVLATNAIGSSAYGASVSFSTSATVPGLPTSVAAGSITPITASISFVAPASTGGSAITGYDVQVATNSGFTTDLQTIADDASPTPLTGLIAGRLYYARVRAKNAVGNGSWTTAITFTTLAGTPVVTSPTSGQTVTVGVAIARVVVTAEGVSVGSQLNAQFSKDPTFATGVVTAQLVVSAVAGDNSYVIVDDTKYLSIGTWYVRVQVYNPSIPYTSPWSTSVTFIESHTPSGAVVSPTAGSVIKYLATNTFEWNFTDLGSPYDIQTAYRVVVENNATGAVLYDSGKVTSAVNSLAVAVGSGNKNIVLRWRVMVWDRGDTASAWSGYGLFTLADAPVVTITSPAHGGTVTSGTPTFTWTVSFSAGGTQLSTLVQVYETATDALVWSKTIAGVALSTTPPTTILTNGKSYYVVVTITDTHNITGLDNNSFTTSYVSPPAVAYNADANDVEELGYVTIEWYNFNPDANFVKWNVYRRVREESTWVQLATIADVNTRDFRDYLFQSSLEYVYTVTQVALRSGEPVEGPIGYYAVAGDEFADNRSVVPDSSHYWLIDTLDNTRSVRVPGVVSDNSQLEFEAETVHVIGRGRHKDYGDELGYAGELQSKVRTPERISSFRQEMEALRRERRAMYLRTPFGRTFRVALGNISWNPLVGTGTSEMGDMSIPYEQVY